IVQAAAFGNRATVSAARAMAATAPPPRTSAVRVAAVRCTASAVTTTSVAPRHATAKAAAPAVRAIRTRSGNRANEAPTRPAPRAAPQAADAVPNMSAQPRAAIGAGWADAELAAAATNTASPA